jgi:hypothetical protein
MYSIAELTYKFQRILFLRISPAKLATPPRANLVKNVRARDFRMRRLTQTQAAEVEIRFGNPIHTSGA